MIKARVHTSDYAFDIPFDATSWFEQAINEEIYDLYNTAWEGDGADPLVEWFALSFRSEPKITTMLAHVLGVSGTPQETDFYCRVDGSDAVIWLNLHRPGWRQEGRGRGRFVAKNRCECGAASVGCGKGCPGHSSWCPWRAA